MKTCLAIPKYFYNTRNMKTIHKPELSIEVAAASFAALGSEQRLAVLRALVRAGPDGLAIGVLGERCGVFGSTLTHHVKILTQAGLLIQSKQGRSIVCAAVAYEQVENLNKFLLEACCADRLETAKSDAHD
jgi:ArsR family transcriptional regulator